MLVLKKKLHTKLKCEQNLCYYKTKKVHSFVHDTSLAWNRITTILSIYDYITFF